MQKLKFLFTVNLFFPFRASCSSSLCFLNIFFLLHVVILADSSSALSMNGASNLQDIHSISSEWVVLWNWSRIFFRPLMIFAWQFRVVSMEAAAKVQHSSRWQKHAFPLLSMSSSNREKRFLRHRYAVGPMIHLHTLLSPMLIMFPLRLPKIATKKHNSRQKQRVRHTRKKKKERKEKKTHKKDCWINTKR